jgi:7-cyano-7-deazaguanine reductase
MSVSNMNEAASRSLGSANSYAVYTDKFDASQLNPMPRILARQDWGIKGDEFVGYDVWHCHEATFLLNNGLPVAGTLKIICPSDSEFMVESKSFKLYLNTFDMCKMGATMDEAIANYENQVKEDVSACIKANVEVAFFKSGDDKAKVADPTAGYLDLYRAIPEGELEKMEITDYNATGEYYLVSLDDNTDGEEVNYFTNVLRSRCRHTKQKDTGAAYFAIKTKQGAVDKKGLLKLVISLREVNEFHEFCAEKLYTEIMSNSFVEECCVMLLYSRRGSLDICPVRATKPSMIPAALKSKFYYTQKAMGQ